MAIKSFLSEGGFSVGSVGSTPIEVIDSSGNVTAVGLTVSGNLIVNGSTTTINSTTTTLDDPIFTLGGDTAPTSDDNKDRGIEFRWHTGSLAKVGFFGYDDSTGKFVFIPDATNNSEVFAGTKGTLDANIEWADVLNKPDPVVTVTLTGDVTGTANATLTDLGNGTITVATTIAADSIALGTDTTGNYVASITNGSYITGGNGGSEGAALTLAVDATSANTASKVVARDASGNFSAGVITGTRLEARNSGTTQIYLDSTTSGSKEIVFQNNGATAGYVWASGSYVGLGGGSAATSLFVTAASGNTGIGTTSPGGRLEVNFPVASGATALILRTSDGGANGTIRWQNSAAANGAAIGSNYNVSDVGALEFLNGNTTNVIFRSSGNVGIGRTNPQQKLHIAGTNARIAISNDADNNWAEIGNDGASGQNTLEFFTGSSTSSAMSITNANNVGIGVSPATRLNVKEENSGTEGFIITNWNSVNTVLLGSDATSGGGKFTLKTNAGTSAVFISSTATSYFNGGSIGIGTSSPGAKLEVSDAAGVTNFAALKLTNTTGSGNANVDILMSAAGNAGGTRIRAIAPGSNHNDLAMYVTNSGTLQATPAIFIQGSTNRVGINRSDPSYNLDVAGSVRTTDWYYVQDSGKGLYNSTHAMWWASHESGSYSLSSNTTSTGIKLYSGGSQNTWRGHFYGDSTGQGFLDSAGNWALRVDSSKRLIAYSGIANIEGTTIRVLNPGGAALNDTTGPATGAIKIKLPTAAYNSNTMMTLVVDIYNYDTGKSLRFRIGGYNYQDGNWYSIFAEQTSDLGVAAYNVRFGSDGTSNCIWIGETNSTWQYPKVFVSEFLGAHSATTSVWASGWAISKVTAFDTVNTTRSASVLLSNNNIANFGVSSITGTANQVTASASTGAVTLSLPQNIHTGATPTFAGGTLNGTLTVVKSNGGNANGSANAAIYLSQDESSIQGPGTNTVIRMGGNLVLGANSTWIAATNGTTALTINNSQNATFAGNLTVSGTGLSSVLGSLAVAGQVSSPANSTLVMDFVSGADQGRLLAKNSAGTYTNPILVVNPLTTSGNLTVSGSGPHSFSGRISVTNASGAYAGSFINTDATTAPGLYVQASRTTDSALLVRNASDSSDLLRVTNSGGTVIGGNLTVSGTGTSAINNLSITPTSGHVYLTGPSAAGKFITLQNGNATGGINFRDSAGNEVGSYYQVTDAWVFSKNTTVSGNLTVSQNLIVNGTTTTVNSTVSTIKDPIVTLGGGDAGTAAASDDNKDRGIEFKWHNGTAAKTGFFGFDDSTGYFTFIPDATNTSEVFSGTQGDIQASNFRGALIGNASTATTLQTARNIAGVSFNGSADITITGQNITTSSGTASNDIEVAKYLRWKNYGNNHILIDASQGTNPGGGAIDKYTPANTINSTGAGSSTWGEAISLMGWNGTATYGVRVDRARSIDNQANSATTTAASTNTANQIVLRDGSGNFSAGTVTAALSGNASTAATWQTARNLSIGGTSKSVNGSADVTWTTSEIGINNGTLTLAVSGTGLSGSSSFTANQSGNSTFTVTSNATSANTASTIVARDGSGNFSAGTITATLAGLATSETLSTVTGRGASTTSQISVGTSAGGSMYTGTKIGSTYGDGISGATFKSITDNPNGGSYAFAAYYGGSGGTNSFYVDALGAGYFRSAVSVNTTAQLVKITTRSGTNSLPATTGTAQAGAGLRVEGGDNAVIDIGANSVDTWIQATDKSALDNYYRLLLNPRGGNVGIGVTTNPGYKLEVNGSFAATTKSFVIKHPTKEGKKLRYGSLEGPENGVYVRGKLKGSNVIELPDYWTKLIDPESITVQLTPIGSHQKLYVEKIEDNKVYIANENLLSKAINCFYYILAERIDVEKLQVEIDA